MLFSHRASLSRDPRRHTTSHHPADSTAGGRIVHAGGRIVHAGRESLRKSKGGTLTKIIKNHQKPWFFIKIHGKNLTKIIKNHDFSSKSKGGGTLTKIIKNYQKPWFFIKIHGKNLTKMIKNHDFSSKSKWRSSDDAHGPMAKRVARVTGIGTPGSGEPSLFFLLNSPEGNLAQFFLLWTLPYVSSPRNLKRLLTKYWK